MLLLLEQTPKKLIKGRGHIVVIFVPQSNIKQTELGKGKIEVQVLFCRHILDEQTRFFLEKDWEGKRMIRNFVSSITLCNEFNCRPKDEIQMASWGNTPRYTPSGAATSADARGPRHGYEKKWEGDILV